jgi:hypothetical protein
MVVVAMLGCQKATPHRAKRVHAHSAPSSSPPADDDAPPPTAAVTLPPTATSQAPAAPSAAPAPPPSTERLTVDRSVPTPLPPPSPALPMPRHIGGRHLAAHAAAAPRPAPAPEPAPSPAPVYKQVADKPQGGPCAGGSGKGERLTVQGVAADDVLNVREAPDKASAVLGGLPPDATGVRGTANRRRVGASTWREVECGQLRGWVNERFLARENGHE